ncbi:MAG: cellulase family glycosylhydrolase [Solirubrobacterales bacterium]|nr:cellulase family glycosylhydrolase [Solirubrobacterales bacterium]
MIRSLALAFVWALMGGVLTSSVQAAPVLPLGHAGRWVTDARGRVVVMHGINMVYKLPPYYPQAAGFDNDDAAFLQRIGFNVVRVGVIWKALEPQPGVYDEGYLKRIGHTVATLARHHIASLLDFHQDQYNERFQGEGFPDWAVQDDGLPAQPKLGFGADYVSMPALWRAFDHFWANSPGPGGVGIQDRYASAWSHVAAHFRSNRNVLGYELMNEPWPGSQWSSCANTQGCPAFDSGQLAGAYRRMLKAIRRVDRRKLVWYEPQVIFNYGANTNLPPLGDRRLGFSFHDYCLEHDEFHTKISCATVGDLPISDAITHSRGTGDALLMTEWGATDETDLLSAMVTRDDSAMIPWIEWAYCGCKDPTTSGPGDKQAIVRDPSKPPRGANLVTGTLRALVEPYPQVIAGTPQRWHFDSHTRTFTFSFSTTRASGRRRFGKGWITEIAMPRLVYGGRYSARVSGAAIVSRRGARVLRIAACRRARKITVTVRPGRRRSRGSCRIRARARRPRVSR